MRKLILTALFRNHRKELVSFATTSSDPAAAEDLVQDAFLRLLEKTDLSVVASPRAYLLKTIANLRTNHFHRQVQPRLAKASTVDPDAIASAAPLTENLVDNRLLLKRLASALDELPEPVRMTFILHKLDGLAYPAIASQLGISSKTAQRYSLKAWQHCLKRLALEEET